ncbi:MAG: bifunctional oligoribonuclease/PAP phosphatase NrnA [Lachnospiraceae bacterium]
MKVNKKENKLESSNQIDIIDECKGAATIGISGHIRPDGDCVGAVLALYQYLQKALPESKVEVLLEQPSSIFSCIKGFDRIQTQYETEQNYDVFFSLDCDKTRLGDAEHLFDRAGKRIHIDHHISNQGCGDLNYVVPTASSTSELIYDLIPEAYLDQEIAKALYIGIIHDTGVFQYTNTAPKTLLIASKLITYGFDYAKIIQETFYEKTYVQNQILGRTLLESMLLMNGQCIVSVLDKKTMDFYGVTSKDLDGIVNQLLNTKGAEVAIFLYEMSNMAYKISMRSKQRVNVAKVAAMFGGGGHIKAAGCTMNGTFHDVINNLSARIEVQLLENKQEA